MLLQKPNETVADDIITMAANVILNGSYRGHLNQAEHNMNFTVDGNDIDAGNDTRGNQFTNYSHSFASETVTNLTNSSNSIVESIN